MGRKLVQIANELVEQFLVTGSTYHCRITAGIPEQAKLRAVTFRGGDLVLTFEHPDWPEGSDMLKIDINTLQD